ncbi:sigma-70 family RNA polymerase sigma factor [Sphingomonas ginsenosidivorax]|uniref:Sigma-70 family RNA polymerase sigma factor n=1 Tax=Sphingomonas ginsenosidivorax TaxID=862135 RepID=A0A5C6UJN8_9SPHN|nr:sigma-70 family RNA polymerase sigma factor [Sphingomonas ginsenosidivorax]TXC72446.1 sigma-70 family RNA polymerase sigma factor [Sphingomonas ginsenosidivorax]
MSAMPMQSAFANATPVPGPIPTPLATIVGQPLTYRPGQRPGGDPNALIREHLPLVRRIAWHVHGSMSNLVEVDDLVQVGLVALVEASATFEDRGGATFRQYVSQRLRGAMIDELRRQATTTRGAMRRRRAYAAAVKTLTGPSGEKPTEAMLAKTLDVSVEKLRADYATADAIKFESVDDLYADDLPWFADDTPSAFDQLADSEMRDALIAAIAALPTRAAQVIQMYYVDELNLEEIGQVLGVGAARVCQIKKQGYDALKKALAGQR